MPDDEFDIHLDITEGFALRDAVTLLGLVADGRMEAAAQYRRSASDGGYTQHQVDAAERAIAKVSEGMESTEFHQWAKRLYRQLAEES